MCYTDTMEIDGIQLATCSYSGFRPDMGIPVRTSLGYPRFWSSARNGPLETALAAAPKGLFKNPLYETNEAFEPAYLALMDAGWPTLEAELVGIAHRHPGKRLVCLCYEDVHTGAWCHRTMLAAFLAGRLGIEVPELSEPKTRKAAPKTGRLF